MSETKKTPEHGEPSASNVPELIRETPVDLERQDVRDKVLLSTSKKTADDLLVDYPDYQKILALHAYLQDSNGLTIAQLRRKALNFCDEYFDAYRRPFDIPDRLVALKVTCKDGDYDLSLVHGYLCFYKHPQGRHRIALKIVPRPYEYKKKPN